MMEKHRRNCHDEFFKTIMDRKLIERTIPALVRQLEKLNESLEGRVPERERLFKKALHEMLDIIFDNELAGHFPYPFLQMVIDLAQYEYGADRGINGTHSKDTS